MDRQQREAVSRVNVQKALILSLIFVLPGIATFLGYYYVSFLASPPITGTRVCEHFFNAEYGIRLRINEFSSGLDAYEEQQIWLTDDSGNTWKLLTQATVMEPEREIDCASQLLPLSADAFAFWNLKALAITQDQGKSWRVHNLCDEPLPAAWSARTCRNATIQAVQAESELRLLLRTTLDDAGYSFLTEDGGLSWQVVDE